MRATPNPRGLIFVLCGPSGSGKTTLRDALIKDNRLKRKLFKSVSFTTRLPRCGERNKRDYFFISAAEFRRRLRQKKILEWTKYLGYYYGTSREFVDGVLRRGRHLILCLDLKGAAKIRRLYPKDSVAIFILPPSLEALRARIEGRCQKTRKTEIIQRLKLAKEELEQAGCFNYSLVNRNLHQAVSGLRGIILKEVGA